MPTLEERYELVIAGPAWERAVRPLLVDSDGLAIGPIRRLDQHGVCQLLVERFDLRAGASARDLAGLEGDSLLLAVDRGAPAALKNTRIVSVVTLRRSDKTRWDGFVLRNGERLPLDRLRIVGPGMPSVSRFGNPALDDDSHLRYSRTAGALGEEVWRKIHEAHVVIAGCGRTGTQFAWQLSGLGIARMTLVDGDTLSLENLDAPGFDADTVGMSKVRALASALVRSRPDLVVHCHERRIHDVLDRLRWHCDLMASCVDEDSARLAVSWLCRETLTPHLDVSSAIQRAPSPRGAKTSAAAPATSISADVRFLYPSTDGGDGGGCVACVGRLDDPEHCLYELAAPPGSLRRGQPADWRDQRAGSLATISAIAAGTAVETWLDGLAGNLAGSVWRRLAWSPERGIECESATVGASPDCPFCNAGRRP